MQDTFWQHSSVTLHRSAGLVICGVYTSDWIVFLWIMTLYFFSQDKTSERKNVFTVFWVSTPAFGAFSRIFSSFAALPHVFCINSPGLLLRWYRSRDFRIGKRSGIQNYNYPSCINFDLLLDLPSRSKRSGSMLDREWPWVGLLPVTDLLCSLYGT